MNLIGERLKVLGSADPTHLGKTGLVLLETANMLVVDSGGRVVSLAKRKGAFELLASGKIVAGPDIEGRLQDRLARRRA